MKKLVYDIKQLVRSNRDGSYATQKKRQQVLMLAARQLSDELGYRGMNVTSLKPKHVEALIGFWRSEGLSISTLKARMSFLRWWAVKIRKPSIISSSNQHYGIGARQYITNESKACDVSREELALISNDYVKMSVALAKAFGLRKEEAIKIIPQEADKGDSLFLRASWCKGGRERLIPILTREQREVLDQAKNIAGYGSLIPDHLKFYQQRNRYESLTLKLGLKKLHGLRHRYAQLRYHELAGWECPHRGGPKRSSLNAKQRKVDREARLIVSRELGHNRIEIVANYIGS